MGRKRYEQVIVLAAGWRREGVSREAPPADEMCPYVARGAVRQRSEFCVIRKLSSAIDKADRVRLERTI